LHIAASSKDDEPLTLGQILERKVHVLIDLRKYRLLGREEEKEGAFFTVEDVEGKKMLIWAISGTETIGIRYVNLLSKSIKAKGVDGGIIASNGRYTESAKSTARKTRIELLPQNFPAFNIFRHHLVPKHEVLTPEEKAEVLEKYRVEPYHLPRIKTSDPIIKVINAKPGDLIKITRKSPTAGEYVSYRYVVEG